MAVAVILSTAMGESMKEDAVTKYFPAPSPAVRSTLVVCPGAMRTVSVEKGLVYVASTSTTVR